jgi:hypothetical protein
LGGASCACQTAGVSTLTEIQLLIAQVIHGKIRSNETDDRDGVTRIPLRSFLRKFLARQYGLKSLALQQLAALKSSIIRYATTSARCRVFGWLTGARRLRCSWCCCC